MPRRSFLRRDNCVWKISIVIAYLERSISLSLSLSSEKGKSEKLESRVEFSTLLLNDQSAPDQLKSPTARKLYGREICRGRPRRCLVKLPFNGDPVAEARRPAICLINRNYFPRVPRSSISKMVYPGRVVEPLRSILENWI